MILPQTPGVGTLDKKTFGHEIVRRARSIDANNLKACAAATTAPSLSPAVAALRLNNLDASPRSSRWCSREENSPDVPRNGMHEVGRGSGEENQLKEDSSALAPVPEKEPEFKNASASPPGAREYFKVTGEGRMHKYNEVPLNPSHYTVQNVYEYEYSTEYICKMKHFVCELLNIRQEVNFVVVVRSCQCWRSAWA